MIAPAAAVDENLTRPFVPNLNAVNMLAPASVAIIAHDQSAEAFQKLWNSDIGACRSDKDIQNEWSDYLFHTFLLRFEYPAFYAGVRVYDFPAEMNIIHII